MASIHREILVTAQAAAVWDAIRDVGAIHTRLAPGFVVDTRMDGDASIVTFGSSSTTDFTVDSDTQITVVSPPHPAGPPVHVIVTTPTGTSPQSDDDRFTYVAADPPTVASLTPASGRTAAPPAHALLSPRNRTITSDFHG